MRTPLLLATCLVGSALFADAAVAQDHHVLRATPENTVLGGFPANAPPALVVGSGDTVEIDVINQSGATNAAVNPRAFFGALGVAESEIDPYLLRFWESLPNRPRYGGHIMTGPVYVDGAQPGDTLEIQVLDLRTRVPYGVNNTGPQSGVFATFYPGFRVGDNFLPTIPAAIPAGTPGGVLPDVRNHLIRTGVSSGEEVAYFSDDIQIPLHKHMGVMALAPATGAYVGNTPDEAPPASGVQHSTPPGPFGGNLDIRDLTVGSKLYLPVEQAGALFYTGDSHGVQGNGEVSGTALEQSLQGTFRFVVHKGKPKPTSPFIEDEEHYIVTGIDWDLDRAMVKSVAEMVKFLVREHGLTEAKAYSMASLAGDFQVAEVVDRTQVVTGKIDKSLFAGLPAPAEKTAEVGGAVPATLSLSLGAAASFEPFVPGAAKEYAAASQATVVSSAGDAALSVSEPGHLVNGAYSLPEPLQVALSKTAWSGPVANDTVDIAFKQLIKAGDALRTGTYSKTLTFTLSTTNP